MPTDTAPCPATYTPPGTGTMHPCRRNDTHHDHSDGLHYALAGPYVYSWHVTPTEEQRWQTAEGPSIREPLTVGARVCARHELWPSATPAQAWTRTRQHIDMPWRTDSGQLAAWGQLRDVVVLDNGQPPTRDLVDWTAPQPFTARPNLTPQPTPAPGDTYRSDPDEDGDRLTIAPTDNDRWVVTTPPTGGYRAFLTRADVAALHQWAWAALHPDIDPGEQLRRMTQARDRHLNEANRLADLYDDSERKRVHLEQQINTLSADRENMRDQWLAAQRQLDQQAEQQPADPQTHTIQHTVEPGPPHPAALRAAALDAAARIHAATTTTDELVTATADRYLAWLQHHDQQPDPEDDTTRDPLVLLLADHLAANDIDDVIGMSETSVGWTIDDLDQGRDDLRSLARVIDRELARRGIDSDDEQQHPDITLAALNDAASAERERIAADLDEWADRDSRGTVTIAVHHLAGLVRAGNRPVDLEPITETGGEGGAKVQPTRPNTPPQ